MPNEHQEVTIEVKKPEVKTTVDEAREILGKKNVLGPEYLTKLGKQIKDTFGIEITFPFDENAPLPSRATLEALRVRSRDAKLVLYPSTIKIAGEERPMNLATLVEPFPLPDPVLQPGSEKWPIVIDRGNVIPITRSKDNQRAWKEDYQGGWVVEEPVLHRGAERAFDKATIYVEGINKLEATGGINVSAPNSEMPARLPTTSELAFRMVRQILMEGEEIQTGFYWTKTKNHEGKTLTAHLSTRSGISLHPESESHKFAKTLPIRTL